MPTRLKEVDVVIVGLGWTGGILAKELSEAGMHVVALERGGDARDQPGLRDSADSRRAEVRGAQRVDAEPGARHADVPPQPVRALAADAPARVVSAG